MIRRDTTVATAGTAKATTYSTVNLINRKNKMDFLSFPSIESFHNIVKYVSVYPHAAGDGKVKYRGKVKLHGTNAGVRVFNRQVAAQSRTQIVTVGNDNAGFAGWVGQHASFFADFGEQGNEYTVFGEWCGPGIMKGTAINQIPNRVFAIFAVAIGPTAEDSVMVTDPEEITKLLGDNIPSDVHVLPWEGEEFTVDFFDREALQKTADSLNAIVVNIEPSDPWVKKTFGVEGVAEGIVYVPGAGVTVPRKTYSDFAFKAKGEKHKTTKTKESVQIDPEVAKSIGEFATMFANEARFEQGLATVGGAEMKNIGQFLKWVCQDILKESADELEASDLEWSQVEKSYQTMERNWFLTKARAI